MFKSCCAGFAFAAVLVWTASAQDAKTIVDNASKDGTADLVERATQGDERILSFDDLPEGERPYFSTILVYNGGEPWR